MLGPFANGGAAADFGVLFFDLGSAAFGDEFGEVGLEGAEGDQVFVGLDGG